ncbi:MAG TPA: helix-turn-helix domain-containing protein [Sulfolobales archaeon]|nr:helix-turn-helix domain-containing protein [Sulfolobales archaeon]
MKDHTMRRTSSARDERIEVILRKTLDILKKHSMDADIIEYPRGERRSVDIVVNKRIIIKIGRDASEISREEIEDLKLASKMLDSAAVIISETYLNEDLEPGVVMDRSDISVMDPETLDLYLSNDKVAIYYKRGHFFVKIDGDALHRKRVERMLSLGELAEIIGTSRKAVYEYERESMDPSIETAQKLIELFGEEIVSRIDLYELTERYVYSYVNKILKIHAQEDPMLRKMYEMGIEAVKLKRTAPDIVGRIEDQKTALVIQRERGDDKEIVEKIINTIKICARLGCEIYAVLSNRGIDREAKKKLEDNVTFVEREKLEHMLKNLARR